jgi:hypothetical protein
MGSAFSWTLLGQLQFISRVIVNHPGRPQSVCIVARNSINSSGIVARRRAWIYRVRPAERGKRSGGEQSPAKPTAGTQSRFASRRVLPKFQRDTYNKRTPLSVLSNAKSRLLAASRSISFKSRACFDCGQFGLSRRKATRDQVGVYKVHDF